MSSSDRIKELEDALKPFADYFNRDYPDLDNSGNPLPDGEEVGWVYITYADFRRAREAMTRA